MSIRAQASLGVHDVAIFSDLDPQVQVALPEGIVLPHVHAAVDRAPKQLVLYKGDWPLEVYRLQVTITKSFGRTRSRATSIVQSR